MYKVILGVDPGYGRVGYGIVQQHNNDITCKTVGCIETSKEDASAQRLYTIYTTLQHIIKTEKPHVLAIEQLFFAKNTKTALRVAETRGLLLLLSVEHAIQLVEFTPLQVKMATCGYGRAEKAQVQAMVTRILKLSVVPYPDDAADALAIALTAVFSKQWN
jgi:crossover junction endodeoxyribonuclease RuvC